MWNKDREDLNVDVEKEKLDDQEQRSAIKLEPLSLTISLQFKLQMFKSVNTQAKTKAVWSK